jgi:enamine deaminase RidA (YjgF/YER057c/UK114 family)
VPLVPVNPESLAKPQGFSHGIKGSGELLFVAGQIGWNREAAWSRTT